MADIGAFDTYVARVSAAIEGVEPPQSDDAVSPATGQVEDPAAQPDGVEAELDQLASATPENGEVADTVVSTSDGTASADDQPTSEDL